MQNPDRSDQAPVPPTMEPEDNELRTSKEA
jgi:hypothetical protein